MIDKDVAFIFSNAKGDWLIHIYQDGKILFNTEIVPGATAEDFAKWFVYAVHECCWGTGVINGKIE